MPVAVQYFKENDAKEKLFYAVGMTAIDPLILAKDAFYAGAYTAKPLGDVLRESEGTPLAKAIPAEIFRDIFADLFESFRFTGTFQAYVYVLQKIFGADVGITFTIPGPGRLQIDIEAVNLQLFDFIAVEIVNNAYVFSEIVDNESDNIVFSSFQGFETQYELEQLFSEMTPNGIFVEINLTLGE